MADKIYPKGLTGFQKRENAPDWVLGTLIIEPRTLVDWLSTPEGKECLTDYQGKKQLKLQILKGQKGNFLNLQVDNYEKPAGYQPKSQPEQKQSQQSSYDDSDALPF